MNNNRQPYQKASEEQIRQADLPGQLIGQSANIAGSAVLGGTILKRVAPLLSSFVPSALAAKGLSKIDQRFGKFIKNALSNGVSEEEAINFIKEKVEPNKSKTPDKRNVIEQYSPELHSFLDQAIKKGRSPIEAGALAQARDEFKNVIKKISQDHSAPFSSILESVFGGAQQPQQAKEQTSQGSQGDQALIAALDKILKM